MSGVLYPVNINLVGKKCLVVGGGTISKRKVKPLLDVGASVLVVSLQFTKEFSCLYNHPNLKLEKRTFQNKDLDDIFLAIAATNNQKLNSEIAVLCNLKNILINVVDNPRLCSFQVPSVYRQGDLTFAVSTNGKSPALASKIKKEFALKYGPEYEKYLIALGEIRELVIKEIQDFSTKKRILNKVLEIDMQELIRLNEVGLLKEWIAECLSW